MAARSQMRGNPTVFVKGEWLYEDGEPTTLERPCTRCGEMPTPEGYDACLGKVEGATSACCGHGVKPSSAKYAMSEFQRVMEEKEAQGSKRVRPMSRYQSAILESTIYDESM
jgi:hypothetical protein